MIFFVEKKWKKRFVFCLFYFIREDVILRTIKWNSIWFELWTISMKILKINLHCMRDAFIYTLKCPKRLFINLFCAASLSRARFMFFLNIRRKGMSSHFVSRNVFNVVYILVEVLSCFVSADIVLCMCALCFPRQLLFTEAMIYNWLCDQGEIV